MSGTCRGTHGADQVVLVRQRPRTSRNRLVDVSGPPARRSGRQAVAGVGSGAVAAAGSVPDDAGESANCVR